MDQMLIIGLLFIVFMCIYMMYKAHHDKIIYKRIRHPKISRSDETFTIFMIADIHRRRLRAKTINKIKKPIDMVCIAGDLLERGVPLKRVEQNIALLKQWQVPIYFVWGNNDIEVNVEELIKLLQRAGVSILEDRIIPFRKGRDQLNVIGFNYYDGEEYACMQLPWQKVPNDFTILLTHKPSAYYRLPKSEKEKIDLVLAGHTHGGQIRFFNIGLYRNGGIRQHNTTTIVVTEGYGYTLLPFRLGTEADCYVLTLE